MSTGTLTLILGGARSGKSTYAERLAAEYARVTYLATAQAFDEEMQARIAKHRADRPPTWITAECPHDVATAILAHAETDCFLLDCLTLYVSNLLLAHEDDAESVVPLAINEMLAAHRATSAGLIIVANEVGLGLVPDNPLGRRYRDLLGRANQQIAAVADNVYFLVAGLPMTVKSSACAPVLP
ncbi:MAG TPA: bifunctional adenosylcobinamide kinase/adenosylcobinamide-phosphate guanylyltransferase [Armatimonadota bacterium]|jgi:adenosylcobinamide kinase/adenosylcobinamide-phosphate guanylyltransferase